MEKIKVTSKIVAEKAGVSRSAVSRCFTPGAVISSKTREKVLIVAKELGYQPNALARTLINGRSKIIGLVVGYFSNPFYPKAVELLSNQLSEKGYHVLLFFSSSESNEAIIDQMTQYQCDAAILMSTTLSSTLNDSLNQHQIPTILFNRIDSFGSRSSVTADNFNGGFAIGNYLIGRGSERIMYVAGLAESSTNHERRAGFLKALKEHDHKLFLEVPGDYNDSKAADLVKRVFLNSDSSPDAIFVANDHMAYAIMDMLRYDLKMKIPDDILVVGFDDAPPSSWLSYSLTTYSQPLQPMVTATIDLVLSAISKSRSSLENLKIPGRLIVRDSTKRG